MNARLWLAHLETYGIKLGLETITAVAARLGNPHLAYPVLHVAGTNGKGSVSAMVGRALEAAGLTTGRYTSPHLIRLEERFAVAGRPVDAQSLDEVIELVRQTVADLHSTGELTVEPTYFEATTAAAFVLFQRAQVDVAVVEVGLGGRYDATNIVDPLATCITTVALDHQAQLGDTVAAIAGEKAGTIKPGVPVVIGPLPAEARDVVVRQAGERGAPLVDALDRTRVTATSHDGTYDVVIETPEARYGPLRLALAGRHQVDNAVVAVRLLETAATRGLRVTPAAIATGLATARWPARLQHLQTARGHAIVDGAHNPAGAAALASYLQDLHPAGLPLVVGMMADKDAAAMLVPLAAVARPLVLTRAPGARAADPAALAELMRRLAPEASVLVEPDVARALDCAWSYGGVIAVAGSLYLAGAVLTALGAEPE